MPELSSFPITERWPASDPNLLQLYAAPTPNGVKISIMLEETGLPYEAHFIDIGIGEAKDPAFVSLNPNGRIPAIIDPMGPGNKPIGLWESGAILIYLADKTGQLLPIDASKRHEVLSWVFFQASGLGPTFGQLGYFLRRGGHNGDHMQIQQRFAEEAKRLLRILDLRLADRDWIADDYSIADIATLGWVNAIINRYDAGELLRFEDYSNVQVWLNRGLMRPAVQRGLNIPARPA